MEKNIVVINGTGGCGKDTFVTFCSKYTKVMNFSSIAKVKEVARVIGWDGEKNEKARKLLSDLKKLTTEYNDMAFNEIRCAVKDFEESDATILFLHIREPEEIKRAVDTFGAKTLLIKRDSVDKIYSNSSDANVENYDYDFIIKNTTLEEFELMAKKFVEELKR